MLQKALKDLPGILDPNVLVGFETADDAGVYLIDENTALVQSTAASPRRPPGRSMSLAAGSRWDEKYIWRQRESDLQKRGLRCGVGSNYSFAAALIKHRQPRVGPEVGNIHIYGRLVPN